MCDRKSLRPNGFMPIRGGLQSGGHFGFAVHGLGARSLIDVPRATHRRHHRRIALLCRPAKRAGFPQAASVNNQMNLPDLDVVIQAVGQDTSSASLSRLLLELEIDEADVSRNPLKLTGRRLWTDEEGTLQLNFKDIGLLKDIPYHDLDEGPWVLTTAVFWASGKNKCAYSGPLPHGLNFSMSRQHVRERLAALNAGNPTVTGLSGNVDIWRIRGLEFNVNFSGPGDSIRCVSVGIPVGRTDRRA